MTASDRVSPQLWFHRIATHYVEAQVLYHLNRAGVFQSLDQEGPQDAATLAAGLGLRTEVLETLLQYATGVDALLARDDHGVYAFTDFGHSVLERFGRDVGAGRRAFNLFDVRTGAYGPVWSALGGLLSGDLVYGENVRRIGGAADDAVYTVGARLGPPLAELLAELVPAPRAAVEVGVHSGLLEHLATARPGLRLIGIDKNPASLERAGARAHQGLGGSGSPAIRWLAADLFDVGSWLPTVADTGPGVLFTIHAHELVACGTSPLQETLASLCGRLSGWRVVLIEQPLLAPAAQQDISESEWLYNCSNALIHHLIGNGRILPHADWLALLERAGGVDVGARSLGYLGYHAYSARLP